MLHSLVGVFVCLFVLVVALFVCLFLSEQGLKKELKICKRNMTDENAWPLMSNQH